MVMAVMAILSLSYPPPTLLIICAGTIAIIPPAMRPISTAGDDKSTILDLE
jgi:hypothetical protein